MSEIIQGFGFTVEPLGMLPYLPWLLGNVPDSQVAPWAKTNFFATARCTITATGQSEVFQYGGSGHTFEFDLQGVANQKAFDWGRQNA